MAEQGVDGLRPSGLFCVRRCRFHQVEMSLKQPDSSKVNTNQPSVMSPRAATSLKNTRKQNLKTIGEQQPCVPSDRLQTEG